MMRKQLSVGLFVVSCLISQSYAVELKTPLQKESYSIGASTGSYISNQLFDQSELGAKADIDAVIDGFIDALKKKQKLSDEEIITSLNNRADLLNNVAKERFDKLLKGNQEEGKKFLADNGKKKGVTTTSSGLQYEVISEGKGEKPKKESVVMMNYKGSLLNGKIFDDTYERKAPAHLSMINVIDGLQEGLMLMNEGSKFKLFIPSKLAYGDEQMQDIPAGSTVVFEIELVKVLKPGDTENSAKPLVEGHKPIAEGDVKKRL